MAGYKGPNFGGKVSDRHEVEFTAEQLKAGLYARSAAALCVYARCIYTEELSSTEANQPTNQANKQAILDRQADLLEHNRPAPYVAGRASGVNY